jgi:ABC-type dipeptide/oligopeptide/nickel transport system permease subunit
MRATFQTQAIDVYIERVAQLFNTLDPFPFHARQLNSNTEEYIVNWARERAARQAAFVIVVHLPAKALHAEEERDLSPAFSRFFAYRADALGRDLNDLFRVGRISLMVGLTVLGLCLAVSRLIDATAGETYLGRFVGESLIIVGWVANWRPIEVFLYDWWPIVRRRNLYRRLAAADVTIKRD